MNIELQCKSLGYFQLQAKVTQIRFANMWIKSQIRSSQELFVILLVLFGQQLEYVTHSWHPLLLLSQNLNVSLGWCNNLNSNSGADYIDMHPNPVGSDIVGCQYWAPLSVESPPLRKTRTTRWRSTSVRIFISRTRSERDLAAAKFIILTSNHVLWLCVSLFYWSERFWLMQSDDPAVQWQLNLYRDVVVKSEEPADPEHSVDRVQSISAAVFHLEQVNEEEKNQKESPQSRPHFKCLCTEGNYWTMSCHYCNVIEVITCAVGFSQNTRSHLHTRASWTAAMHSLF